MKPTQPSVGQQIRLLQINAADNVAVAMTTLNSGQQESVGKVQLTLMQDVNLGAKLAIKEISMGEKVIKYGEPIGSATRDIRCGEYVHTHNLRSDYLSVNSDDH